MTFVAPISGNRYTITQSKTQKTNPKHRMKNILKTSIAVAVLGLVSATTAQATLIRLDLGGNGVPADGFVEYKASSTLAQRIAVDTDRDGVGTISTTESRDPGGAWFGASGGLDISPGGPGLEHCPDCSA